jgi:PD-(D/E)XK nuclease superfamily
MEINGPIVVGASSLATYRDCHEKYRNRYVELLVPKKRDLKVTFGSAFHAGADTYYRTNDIDQAEEAFVKVAKEADLPLMMDDSAEPRSVERGISLLRAWVERWQDEPFTLLRRKDGEPMTELRFTVELFEYKGFPVVYSGVIDKIVEAGGRIYIPDIKTTRRGLSQFQNSMRPNHQLTGYYYGAKHVLPEGKVFAVGYDAVFISERKPNPKKARTEDKWWAYGIDIKKDFMRTFTTRSDRDLEIWKRLIINDTWDIIRDIESDEPVWSMNAPAACTRYGRCEYTDLCVHNQDPIVRDSLYERKEWQPYAESREDYSEETNVDNGTGT